MTVFRPRAALGAALVILGSAHQPVVAQDRAMDLLMRADIDRDGQITRQEFVDARIQLFVTLDRNGDGFVSSDDAPLRPLVRRQALERLQQLVLSLDSNGDGRLSRDEFTSGPSYLFALADSNGDGIIDRGELEALPDLAAGLER